MRDILASLETIALTALFNPAFLALLLILFFVGKFFGKLTKRLNIWKILLLGYFGLFLYGPVRDAGPILGGIFLLGMASNHTRLIFSIFGWAQSLGDVVFAFRYRSAFNDMRRRERELDDREQQIKEEERRRAYSRQENGQHGRTGWQQEAGNFRKKSEKTQSSREKGNDKASQSRYQSSGTQPQEGMRGKCLRVLGLRNGKNYSPDEIKQAYRKKARVTHPDAGGSQVEFIEVVNAYEWLKSH